MVDLALHALLGLTTLWLVPRRFLLVCRALAIRRARWTAIPLVHVCVMLGSTGRMGDPVLHVLLGLTTRLLVPLHFHLVLCVRVRLLARLPAR